MKISEKLTSRKLFVWVVWTGIAVASLFVKDLPKEIIFEFYGLVSLLYIGSNTAQKWIFRKDNVKPPSLP